MFQISTGGHNGDQLTLFFRHMISNSSKLVFLNFYSILIVTSHWGKIVSIIN